jgi:ABC-type multidrug transport system ATPase subunit
VSRAWQRVFQETLVELGVEKARADDLTEDTLSHAVEAGQDPHVLFGPAHAYARHLLDTLQDVPDPKEDTSLGVRGPQVLVLAQVTKRYRRRVVLDGVDLTVRAGEVAAVVGANGSGKSTLLKICAGLVQPDGGQVYRRGTVGYVPQDGGTVALLTAQEHFTLFGAAAGLSSTRAGSTGQHLAAQLSWRPDPAVRAAQLSGGTRQKLSLILGELHAPDLLLLDEPYQGFDQGTYVNFWQQVWRWREAGKAVVLVTHLLHELDQVDHVVELTTPDEES